MAYKPGNTRRTIIKKPKPVEKVKPEPTPEELLSAVRTRQKAHNKSLRGK